MLRQFCLPVHLSVTRVDFIKTAEHIEILSLSHRTITLVFRHQGLFRKSDGFTHNRGAEYKGVAIFDQNASIYYRFRDSRIRFFFIFFNKTRFDFLFFNVYSSMVTI